MAPKRISLTLSSEMRREENIRSPFLRVLETHYNILHCTACLGGLNSLYGSLSYCAQGGQEDWIAAQDVPADQLFNNAWKEAIRLVIYVSVLGEGALMRFSFHRRGDKVAFFFQEWWLDKHGQHRHPPATSTP